MRTMWLFLRVAAASSAVAVTAVPPVAAQVSGADAEKAAAAFLQAFVSGDGTRMKEHFAEKVRIDRKSVV